MRKFGLIGYPLSHSFSKKYFAAKFEKEGIRDASYELFPIPSIDELPDILHQHPDLLGLNVTIPYKEKLFPFLANYNSIVQATGACNCIRIENGLLNGFNTDVIGFENSLVKKLQPHHRAALLLGTGGAAKAVAFVLQNLGIRYKSVSRKKGEGVIGYADVTPELLQEYLLVINTTPLGMYPAIEECPELPYDAISFMHYFFDLVYNPEKTLFLQKAEQKGATVENGLEMLVIQAEESWNIWNE